MKAPIDTYLDTNAVWTPVDNPAAENWKEGDMPYVICEGAIIFMGFKLRCYVLNNQMRIVDADDMNEMLKTMFAV